MAQAGGEVIELTIDEAAREMEDTLRAVAPRGESGDLEKGIDGQRVNRFEALFTSDAYYSEWVIEGTPPHDIYPNSKDALWWEGAEHPVKHVRHPGTRAQNFPRDAREIEENRIEGYAADAASVVRRRYG